MKGQKIFAQRTKALKKLIYFKKTVCIKILLSRWMQSWLHRRSFPRSLREWYEVFTFFEEPSFCFFSICSFGNDECSDYNLAEEFSRKSWKFFAQSTKLVKKNVYFKKTVCINILLSQWRQCWPPRGNFPCSFREGYKNCTFFRKIHFLFFLKRIL